MKKIKPIPKKQRHIEANNVAERWKKVYFKNSKWYEFNSRNSDKTAEQVWFALLSLGRNPDPDKVDTIIGNTSWTQNPPPEHCTVCNNLILNGVELSDSSSICIVCLEEAGKLCN